MHHEIRMEPKPILLLTHEFGYDVILESGYEVLVQYKKRFYL